MLLPSVNIVEKFTPAIKFPFKSITGGLSTDSKLMIAKASIEGLPKLSVAVKLIRRGDCMGPLQ